jgi:uncharacterized damage-inducible protein DinB
MRMTIPLVTQLRFVRSEFKRCLEGVSEKDAVKRLKPMNCISWSIGHMAVQENFYWVYMGQGKIIHPDLIELVGYGKPASTPPLKDMWKAWSDITQEADVYLDRLTPNVLVTYIVYDGKKSEETIGTMLYRNIYHYWFHTGEAHAVRQMLGHKKLPQFVGDMSQANYSLEE